LSGSFWAGAGISGKADELNVTVCCERQLASGFLPLNLPKKMNDGVGSRTHLVAIPNCGISAVRRCNSKFLLNA
jgi:hypothetical protein